VANYTGMSNQKQHYKLSAVDYLVSGLNSKRNANWILFEILKLFYWLVFMLQLYYVMKYL